jgi:hypothetical protein
MDRPILRDKTPTCIGEYQKGCADSNCPYIDGCYAMTEAKKERDE